jgi:hypothetical protein
LIRLLSLPNGKFGTSTLVAVTPRVPGPYTLSANIEVQDYLGATLRRETRSVPITGAGEEEFMLEQKSPNDYKAIVTFLVPGKAAALLGLFSAAT